MNFIAYFHGVFIEKGHLHSKWPYLPTPPLRARYDTRSIFKRSLTGLNSEFSFSLTSCLTKAEESSLPYYLPIARGRIIGFIPFPRVLVLCEMPSVSSGIWTRVHSKWQSSEIIEQVHIRRQQHLIYEILRHFIFIYITVYKIIIMSCRQHIYPWPSLATFPYRSSPLAGLQGYIPYPHRAAVCMFELVVLLLLGHMWGSIGVHHLWARPCFSSSVLHVWFV